MLTGKLHPYQEPVVDQALDRGKYLIAADMGTGKTPMAIAIAEELLGCGDVSRCVIVCPANLRYQWAQALAKFTDLPTYKMKVSREMIVIPRVPHLVILDGRAYQRGGVKYTAADDRKQKFAQVNDKTEYVIMSYETVLDEQRRIRQLDPGLVILDECTQIKTFRARRAKLIKKLLSPQFRIGLTGTPLENGKPEELFSIMQWVDEDVLGRWDLYDKSYIERDPDTGFVTGWKNLPVLRERLAPAMARISRHDAGVREFMPESVMDDWTVELPAAGPLREAYATMGADLLSELKKLGGRAGSFDLAAYYGGQADESTRVGKIMAIHTAMERLLDHPDLVILSGELYAESGGQDGSGYSHGIWRDGLLDDVWDSPKLTELKDRLDPLLAAGAKVLVFSKYRTMLSYIEAAFAGDLPSVLYHGKMTARQKAAAIAEFTAPDRQLFLSSHAGAYGMDMNMADHLVNYDNSVIAGRADQVNARHIRASSEFTTVHIHNMFMPGTIEERNLLMQDQKRLVAASVMGDVRGVHKVRNTVPSLTKFLEETLGLG